MKKSMKKLIKPIIAIAVILIIAGAGYFAYIKHKPVEQKTKVINFGFEKVGELVSLNYYFTIVDDSSDPGTFLPWDDKRLICSYDGYIKFGTDLTQVKTTHDDTYSKIEVTVPKVDILGKPTLDEDSFINYLEKGKQSATVNNDVRKAIKKKALDQAKENGAYEQATKQAEKMIKNMVIPVVPENAEITVNFE